MEEPKEVEEEKSPGILEEFGFRLKEARFQLKLSQKDFGKKMGITGSFISEIEKGKKYPGMAVLKNLGKIYNISMDYLINGKGRPFFPHQDNKPASFEIGPDNPDKEKIRQLLQYMANSPFVKYAMLTYFIDFLHRNKETIEENLAEYQGYLEGGPPKPLKK
jgi:transcriptional regulator with XRE-family HTH domain